MKRTNMFVKMKLNAPECLNTGELLKRMDANQMWMRQISK